MPLLFSLVGALVSPTLPPLNPRGQMAAVRGTRELRPRLSIYDADSGGSRGFSLIPERRYDGETIY